MRNAGYNILVVGIGPAVNSSELHFIAGYKKNLFISPSFNELLSSNLVNEVKKQSCPVGKLLGIYVDIYFALS